MKQFHENFTLPFNITIPKYSHIEILYSSKNSTCDKICVGNGGFFYFNDDGKLDIYYIFKRRYPVIKKIISCFH